MVGGTNTQVITADNRNREKKEEAGTGEIFLFIWYSNGIGKEKLGINFLGRKEGHAVKKNSQ